MALANQLPLNKIVKALLVTSLTHVSSAIAYPNLYSSICGDGVVFFTVCTDGVCGRTGSSFSINSPDLHSLGPNVTLITLNTAGVRCFYYSIYTGVPEKNAVLRMINLEPFAVKCFLQRNVQRRLLHTIQCKICLDILCLIAGSSYTSAGWCAVTQINAHISDPADRFADFVKLSKLVT